MTPPEPADIVLNGSSGLADPLAALRAALVEIGKGLAAHGASPGAVSRMTWTASEPAAIHPLRTLVDLSLRESFGGARPKIEVHRADHDGVRIVATAKQPAAPDNRPVWNGFTQPEIIRAYSTRGPVRDMPALLDSWRNDGAAFRARQLTAELPYGPAASETLDLYMPTSARGPVPLWIFIHGGYWQAIDKAGQGQFGGGMLASGYAVAMVNYTLAPVATLHQITSQIQAAVRFLAREASALGCDPNALHISGHSAGGQLAAMIAAHDEGRLIKSCLPLSGVFDLAPLAAHPMGPVVGLHSPDDVYALSPHHHRPKPHVRIGVAVGGAETDEFKRQSVEFAQSWGNAPCRIIEGKNHFDLLDGLNSGELLDFAKQIAR